MTEPTWRVLPSVVVRSTGFPIELCDQLRVEIDDRLAGAEDHLERATVRARQVLAPVAAGAWGRRAAQALATGTRLSPPPDHLPDDAAAALAEYERARAARDELRATHAARFDEGLLHARSRLIELCRRPALREVLFASSDTAYTMATRLLERPFDRWPNSKQRADEDRIALFIQRLCAKNETSSFYGPIFWGNADGDGWRFEPGGGAWLSERLVFVEHWAVVALADAIARDPEVAPHLRPWLNPSCRLDGGTLHVPVGQRVLVGEETRRMVELADGRRSAAELRETDPVTFDLLRAKRVLQAGFDVPAVLRAHDALRAQVAELPAACAAREAWLERLDELAALCLRYRDADLDGRVATRAAIDARVAAWTSVEPSRGQGRMFVGRRVVHELCRRNVRSFECGALARELEGLLAPMCDLARWVFLDLADGYERRFAEALAAHEVAGGAMDLLSALRVIRPLENEPLEAATARRVLEAWRAGAPRVVSAGEAAEDVTLTREQLSAVVTALPSHPLDLAPDRIFGAAFHSPDVLLCAEDEEAIGRGDYQVVLGELHGAAYAIASPIYLPFCPSLERVLADGAALAGPDLAVLADSPRTYNVGNLLWPDVPGLREVVHEGAASRLGRARELPISRLAVMTDGRRVEVVDRDGGLRMRLPSLYQAFLHRKAFATALVPFEGGRAGRVAHGRAVLRRRSWRFSAGDWPQVTSTGVRTLEGHAALRRWQARHGLPDRIFSRVAGEPKPVMVDFRSPLLCSPWLRLCEEGAAFSASEMLPAPEDMWLRDRGARYSSEIRLTMALAARVS